MIAMQTDTFLPARTRHCLAVGILVLVSSGPLASAYQDSEDFPSMDEILSGEGAAGPEDPEARIRRLFGEVETKLKQVDILLSDAAAGDTSALTAVEDSGIASLLQSSLERGRQAQEDIREIIDIAQQLSQQQPQPSSSGSQGQGGEPGSQSSQEGSPLNRGQQSSTPEPTPSTPGEEPGQQQPTPGGDQREQGQQSQDQNSGGTDPKDPRGDPNLDGQNRDGDDSTEGAVGSSNSAEGTDGWGDLPTHVRDTFRSEGRSELPARYRDWIDEYYRKMNRRGPRR